MIQPLMDYVLLEKMPSEKKVGSIILTSEKKQGNLATVVAVGPGKLANEGASAGTLVKIKDIKAGQKVIYREYSGTDYEEGDHKYLLIKAEDIMAIVEDK
ncbi:MAG: 10 kDa chaperonin [Tenericutes bacterium ADurb.BinA155]|jgi:chaperonin GroES|nr:MAG: 10 kDa chaperonin [Tenericutes bacterium ADurb.BinA155]